MNYQKLIEAIDVNVTKDIDTEYDRIINIFQDHGINVYFPEYLNSQILSKDFTRVFNVYEPEQKSKHTFFVINSAWNETKINKLLNSFTQPNPDAKVYFLSGYPLPAILQYLNLNAPSSFFELDSLRNLQNIESKLESKPEILSELFHITCQLADKYFHINLQHNIPDCLKNIEELIIEHFRSGEKYDSIDELNSFYTPTFSINLLGFYLAYILKKDFSGELFFDKKSFDLSQLGIGFSSLDDDVIDMVAHPLEKVTNFYNYGKDSSVINWYYEIRYFLKNKQKNS